MDAAHKERLTKFLNQYEPLIEKLSTDEKLSEKLRQECLELLQVKKQYDHSADNFIDHQTLGLLTLLKAERTLKDLAGPFGDELKNQAVEDILKSAGTDKWEIVMQDMGLLSTLHKAQDQGILNVLRRGKDSPKVKRQNQEDMEYINEQLEKKGWLPEVKFCGISYMDGKNLRFSIADQKPRDIYIDNSGTVKVVLDQKGKIIGPTTSPFPKLRQYLKSTE